MNIFLGCHLVSQGVHIPFQIKSLEEIIAETA
jgi:hypothetical protein